MKKILTLLAGMALVLTAGLAFAEDLSGNGDPGDKMIRNEDLSHIQLDQDKATLNQMPSEAEGSAAGGMSTDSESMGTKMDEGKTPADKGAVESGTEGQGAGGGTKDSDTWQKDMKKEESPADKGSEGWGSGDKGPDKDSNTYRY